MPNQREEQVEQADRPSGGGAKCGDHAGGGQACEDGQLGDDEVRGGPGHS